MKGKVICTDLDGTLFFPKKRVFMMTKKNRRFLQKFVDNGGRLAIVSGRNRYFAEKLQKNLKRRVDVLGCNSSFIEVDGKTIREVSMDNQKLFNFIQDMKKDFPVTGFLLMSKNHNLVAVKKDFWWFHNIGYHIYFWSEGVYREPFIQNDDVFLKEVTTGQVFKLMLFFGVTKKAKQKAMLANKELRKRYPDFEFSWCGELIEVTAKGCSKAEGIKIYLDYHKINSDNVMVVGDSGNDISMFQAFENSFCMEHAPLTISKYANNVIRSVDELALYLENKGE